ncbi:Trihelix transcription factor ENAP1 [Linum perenne]
MDDMEDDARYPHKAYPNNRTSKKSSLYSHRPVSSFYNRHDYADEEENLDDDDENGIESDDNDIGRGYPNDFEQNEGFGRYPKRQKKLKNSVSNNYELVPRSRMANNNNHGESEFPGEWSEQEKFVLLEVWGERFLQLGRNSLRSVDWVEVAEKVSEALKIQRTEAQCRQLMDSLKRRYRKEKGKGGQVSKWAFYRKMDMLMRQENGNVGSSSGGFSLSCGLDSGEYVFMDTGVYLDRANGFDEMRDSPCESEEDEEEDNDKGEVSGDMFKGLSVLADSVHKFGEIYEKIESSKRDQMLELERMRVEFQRELELQKKQILERAQSEISKIKDDDDDEDVDDDEDTDTDSVADGVDDNGDGEGMGSDNDSGDDDLGANVSG